MTYAVAASAVTVAPAPESSEALIDRAHLAQMTLGDAALEREILSLFARQAELLMERMQAMPPAAVSTLAHTLKGSARGVGAWKVARAAEAVELADGTLAEFRAAIERLGTEIVATRALIADMLRTH
jgi:HPt (histidine-containing phosphotransfer) domain-containing protein